jgi:hypothetical protein
VSKLRPLLFLPREKAMEEQHALVLRGTAPHHTRFTQPMV